MLSNSDLSRLLAYVVLAVASWFATRTAQSSDRVAAAATLGLAVAFGLALALGLAGELAQRGRQLASEEGWYADRRPLQAAVVVALLTVTVSALAALALVSLGLSRRARVLVGTMLALVAYVAVHTITLHQLDSVLNRDVWSGIRQGDLLEIALVLSAATVAASMATLGRTVPGRMMRTGQ